jgi:hypothetical protein
MKRTIAILFSIALVLATLGIAPFAWNQYLIAVKRQHDYERQVAAEKARASAVFRAALTAALEESSDQLAREYLADAEAYLAKVKPENRVFARDYARKMVLARWPKYFHREITEGELGDGKAAPSIQQPPQLISLIPRFGSKLLSTSEER